MSRASSAPKSARRVKAASKVDAVAAGDDTVPEHMRPLPRVGTSLYDVRRVALWFAELYGTPGLDVVTTVDAAEIMRSAITQACFELRAAAAPLEQEDTDLHFALCGVATRLEAAGEVADALQEILQAEVEENRAKRAARTGAAL